GPARDLDVLATKAIVPLRRSNPDKPEVALLERKVKRDRKAKFKDARRAVASKHFQEVVLTAALWLIDGDWTRVKAGPVADRRATQRAEPIDGVAADILERRSRKIVHKTKGLKDLGGLRRHKLRIAVKKLRYGCDFFESLFGHQKAQKKYRRALEQLQGCLGTLNDMRVHAGQAHRIANPRGRGGKQPQQAQEAYAIGLLT